MKTSFTADGKPFAAMTGSFEVEARETDTATAFAVLG